MKNLAEPIEELRDSYHMPVHTMELLIAAGGDAVPALSQALGDFLADESWGALWLSVVLGELRDPRAAGALAAVLRSPAAESSSLAVAASEALARIGPAALPELQRLAGEAHWRPRLWAYAAAIELREDAAHQFLLHALHDDAELSHIVAGVLADQGRRSASPAIYAALTSAEPWQRADFEAALCSLERGVHVHDDRSRNWRVRYRLKPDTGTCDTSWPVIAALMHTMTDLRERRAIPIRPLDEILRDCHAHDVAEHLCECCNMRTWLQAGIAVCPATSAELPGLQLALLEAAASQLDSEDIFDLLDAVDNELIDLHEKARPRSRAARERHEEAITIRNIVRATCLWAVDQNLYSINDCLARLQAVAPPPHKLAHARPAAQSTTRVKTQRNEPCPCGSGRKYKKCCADHLPRTPQSGLQCHNSQSS